MTVLLLATSSAGHYLHWGVISISLTNASIVLLMLLVFVGALFVPLGRRQGDPRRGRRS
ncbi:MAG: hypothetical protein M3Y66_01610 [Actinomycetota bacterium]|nr:hypothetical protein [Actinomycetota bacterium]